VKVGYCILDKHRVWRLAIIQILFNKIVNVYSAHETVEGTSDPSHSLSLISRAE
jgi:hypothetical protein